MLNSTVRSLPVCLAHQLSRAKPGTTRVEMLSRIYRALKARDQLLCQSELQQIRQAKSGRMLSTVH